MTSSQWHCIQRNNHYSKLLNFFDELMYDQIFADVTLILDDVMLKCHKIVLASCSTYFSTMFLTLPREQTIIMLKDVKYSEMKPILEYIYRGKMNVTEDQLGDLLKVAETLQVEGLVKEDSNRNKNNPRREDTMDMTTTPPLDISINNGDNVPTRRPLSLHSSMDHHSYIHNPYTDVFFLSKEKSFPQLYAKDINSSKIINHISNQFLPNQITMHHLNLYN